jgi:prolyl-tRNA synthetase
MKRLSANLEPAQVAPAELDEGGDLAKGYIGPQSLPPKVRYVVDPLVVRGSAWVTGANDEGHHAANVVSGRDFEPSGTVPAAEIRAGDRCGRCGMPMEILRGIEIGHIFQLGRKFADAFELDVLNADGKPTRVTMGSYGIGVTRAVAAIAEQTHDDVGLLWPRSIAPADVHVIAVGKGEQREVAERVATDLHGAGLRVLFDDRGVSPGVAFKDAELIGVPTVLVVGKRITDGILELRDRRTGTTNEIAAHDAVGTVTAALRS